MRTQLRVEARLLLRWQATRATGNRLGGQRLGYGQLVPIALQGADTDADDLGYLRLRPAASQGIEGVLSQVERVGTPDDHLPLTGPQLPCQHVNASDYRSSDGSDQSASAPAYRWPVQLLDITGKMMQDG